MRIKDLLGENKWDDFGRTEFPDEYFTDGIDLNHEWLKSGYTRFKPKDNVIGYLETGAMTRSPYDFMHDLYSYSSEQLNNLLLLHGIPSGIDITAPGSKLELIKLVVRNQEKIAAGAKAVSNQTRPS